jgi:hypothetical protein
MIAGFFFEDPKDFKGALEEGDELQAPGAGQLSPRPGLGEKAAAIPLAQLSG